MDVVTALVRLCQRIRSSWGRGQGRQVEGAGPSSWLGLAWWPSGPKGTLKDPFFEGSLWSSWVTGFLAAPAGVGCSFSGGVEWFCGKAWGWPGLGTLTPPSCPGAGGSAAAGDGGGSRAVADATELPSPGAVAEGSGEVPGEDRQAPPRLPPMAHHGPHQGLPHWDSAEVLEGLASDSHLPSAVPRITTVLLVCVRVR